MAERASGRQSYSRLQQASHWAVALLCIFEFPTARGIQRAHIGHACGIKPPKLDVFFASAHEWAGWIILALVLVLIGSRLLYGAPTLPSGMQGWQRWLAHGAHAAIYLSLLGLVGSGAVAMYLDGRFAFLHAPLSKIGVGLIALHLAAVGWHQLIRRDHLLARMLPAGGTGTSESE